MDFANCIRVNDCLMNRKKTNVMNYVKNKINLRIPTDILTSV